MIGCFLVNTDVSIYSYEKINSVSEVCDIGRECFHCNKKRLPTTTHFKKYFPQMVLVAIILGTRHFSRYDTHERMPGHQGITIINEHKTNALI